MLMFTYMIGSNGLPVPASSGLDVLRLTCLTYSGKYDSVVRAHLKIKLGSSGPASKGKFEGTHVVKVKLSEK